MFCLLVLSNLTYLVGLYVVFFLYMFHYQVSFAQHSVDTIEYLGYVTKL